MSINNTSQDKVNNFFKNLENFKSHNIFIHTDKDTSLKHAKNADSRKKKLSQIDGELFAVKANIKVNSFPFDFAKVYLKLRYPLEASLIQW